MIEDKLRKLSYNDYIEENIDHIIEAFVTFYGEEEREFITQRIKSFVTIPFRGADTLSYIIEEIKTDTIKKAFHIDPDKFIYTGADLLYQDIKEKTDYYLRILDEPTLAMLFDGDTDIKVIKNKIAKKEYPQVLEFLEEFEKIQVRLAPYEEEDKRNNERKQQIDKKYYGLLMHEFEFLFTKEEIAFYDSVGISSPVMDIFLGYTMDDSALAFTEKSEALLNDPNEPEYKKQLIKKNRINYLNSRGINLSKDKRFALNRPTYEDYLQKEGLPDLIKKLVAIGTKVEKRKKELNEQRTIETVKSLEDYKIREAQLNQHDFVNKDIPLGPYVYTDSVSLLAENFIFDGQNYVLRPVVLLNLGGADVDGTLIHEFNHGFELFIYDVDDKGCHAISGWDYIEAKFTKEKKDSADTYDGISRPYELLSEYVNERISQEITAIMHSQGHHIYSQKQCSDSVYMEVEILLEDFYQTFKSIIIKSRSHGNINYIFECLGKENFEALNDLCNELYGKYGFDVSSVVKEAKNKPNGKIAQELSYFTDKRDVILNNMKQHLLQTVENQTL